MNIQLTNEEEEILNEILQGALTTLGLELHRADDLRFKENLKHRINILQGLLAKIPQPASA